MASQGRSWEDVQEEAERVFTELVAQVERLPEEVFVNQDEIVWQIMACGGKHPYRHLAEFVLQRGEGQRAMDLYNELIEGMRQMPLPPEELGVLSINLRASLFWRDILLRPLRR